MRVRRTELTAKKKLLNTLAVENMTIDRIVERGAFEEIEKWLVEIGRLAT